MNARSREGDQPGDSKVHWMFEADLVSESLKLLLVHCPLVSWEWTTALPSFVYRIAGNANFAITEYHQPDGDLYDYRGRDHSFVFVYPNRDKVWCKLVLTEHYSSGYSTCSFGQEPNLALLMQRRFTTAEWRHLIRMGRQRCYMCVAKGCIFSQIVCRVNGAKPQVIRDLNTYYSIIISTLEDHHHVPATLGRLIVCQYAVDPYILSSHQPRRQQPRPR